MAHPVNMLSPTCPGNGNTFLRDVLAWHRFGKLLCYLSAMTLDVIVAPVV